MELRIVAFKGSPWQIGNTHEAVIEVRNAKPDELLGAHLVWRTQTGRVVRGKVIKRHGHDTSRKLVARFHKGLPGQALGQVVEVRAAKAAKAEKRSVKATAVTPRAAAAKASARGPKVVKLVFTEESAIGVHIVDTQFDAPGKDKGKGLVGEFVELKNKGKTAANLSGFSLKDESNHVYKFPDGFTLAPGATVKVRTGKGKDTAHDLFWGRAAAVWNNDGDTASLVDTHGKTQAKRAWKPEA